MQKEEVRYQIIRVEKKEEFEELGKLFREYQQFLGKDLSFQNFEEELQQLKRKYNDNHGALLLLLDLEDNAYAGCIGLRIFKGSICEMKRLYVRPAYRAKKYGRKLVESILEVATELGYQEMYLDTLRELKAAVRLYEKLGFVEIAPYYNDNPYEGVVYMRKIL